MKPSQLRSFLPTAIRARWPILITGEPGIGKSDIVTQACDDLGVQILVSHPVTSDPTDYKGMPAAFQRDGRTVAEFLPFGDLLKLIDAAEPTVAFIDDIGQAPHGVQAALMQLLLARRVNGHHISDHVTFIAATNRASDRAGVNSLLEPVKSRFHTILKLEPDLHDYCTWALDHHLPPEHIAFLRNMPQMLHKFEPTRELTNSPSPRTNAHVAALFEAGITDHEIVAGAAGEEYAVNWAAFLKLFNEIPSIDAILLDPMGADVPTKPDVLWALAVALAKRTDKQNAARAFTYLARLPKEQEVFCVRDLQRYNKDILKTSAFTEWAVRNAAILG